MGYVDWFATMRANVFFDEVTEPIEKDVFLDSKGAGQKTIIPSYVLWEGAGLAIPKGVDTSNPGRKGNSRPPGDWDLNGRLGSTAKLGNVSANGRRS